MPSQKFKDMFKEKPFAQIDLDEYWNAPSTKGGKTNLIAICTIV